MIVFDETLDPSETKDFSFDWSPQLGDGETVVSQVVVFIAAAGSTSPSDSVASPISRVWLTGGIHGQRIIFTIAAVTSGGRTLEAALAVDVVDSLIGPPAETELARLSRYLSEAREALHKLATGSQVVDLWHDGRRRRYAQQDVSNLTAYVDWLERQIESATAVESGRPRRAAFGLIWRN